MYFHMNTASSFEPISRFIFVYHIPAMKYFRHLHYHLAFFYFIFDANRIPVSLSSPAATLSDFRPASMNSFLRSFQPLRCAFFRLRFHEFRRRDCADIFAFATPRHEFSDSATPADFSSFAITAPIAPPQRAPPAMPRRMPRRRRRFALCQRAYAA